jgi:chromate transporter
MSARGVGNPLDNRARLSDVVRSFLRLGFTAFGGPAAHIAMMEDEVVRRRKWISAERFLDMLGAANLIPGPSSSELAVLIGQELAGWRGLIAAGVCFVLPAALMTTAIAWAYVKWGSLPRVGGVLYGVAPVVIAVVLQALASLSPKATKKSAWLIAVGMIACVASAFGVAPLIVLGGAAALCVIARAIRREDSSSPSKPHAILAPTIAASGAAVAPATSISLGLLFLTFLKIGATIFGSGYVLLAFLRADFVDRLKWLSESQLLDAVAVGQVTPGPVFTTATFIGFVLARGWGALLATIAIFLPGFLLVAAIRPIVARVRSSPMLGAALDGVNVASLALMAVVTFHLARRAIVDPITIALAIVAAVALLRFKIGSSWLVLGGAIVGALVHAR